MERIIAGACAVAIIATFVGAIWLAAGGHKPRAGCSYSQGAFVTFRLTDERVQVLQAYPLNGCSYTIRFPSGRSESVYEFELAPL